jgi:hypothetical protein
MAESVNSSEQKEHPLEKLSRKIRAKTARAVRRRLQKKKLRTARVLIVSYPKSGRTWLRVMLTKYMQKSEHLSIDSLDAWKVSRMSKRVDLFEFTHEQAEHKLMIRADELCFDEDRFQQRKVLFLHRDPRDTAVSMYFHLSKREKIAKNTFYTGTLHQLLRDKLFGLEKVVAFNQMWLANGGRCKDFMAISYEELRENPVENLARILAFLGDASPDKEVIREVVDAASFERMQKEEQEGRYDHESLALRKQGDADALKVRRGIVGGYKDYFSEEDLRYADQVIEEARASGSGSVQAVIVNRSETPTDDVR